MASNTGCTAVGELEMTRKTSLVAVCWSSASVSSAFRAASALAQPDVLDGALVEGPFVFGDLRAAASA